MRNLKVMAIAPSAPVDASESESSTHLRFPTSIKYIRDIYGMMSTLYDLRLSIDSSGDIYQVPLGQRVTLGQPPSDKVSV